ncbi:MAG: type VI secretion system tube protein Hcp [Proteobacteria bacterium]|nr:type VI secretion system tube protein Hcp [Pseudomonadota bacterium]
MPIYMFMPGIPGSTTAQGYNQWIPLSSVDCGVGRIIDTAPGRVVDRIRSTPLGTEMEITKPLDQSSPLLFSQVCGGPAISEVKIDVCRATTDGLVSYWQYVLSNVLLSEYCAFCDTDNGHLEFITLNYTDIEISFILYDDYDTPTSAVRAQAAVGCQPSQATHIRRPIQAKTLEGFNLFIATVYGEAGGVQIGNQAAWQAVGSVIMNRIHSGIWHRYATSDDIIKHTGFNAYANPSVINWNHVNFNNKHIKNHQQFFRAWAALHGQSINHHNAMTRQEQNTLTQMKKALQNIYDGQSITKANYYYSPRSMHGKQPSFLSHLKNPEQYKVPIPGISEHDFKFYYIPPQIERAAGKKL